MEATEPVVHALSIALAARERGVSLSTLCAEARFDPSRLGQPLDLLPATAMARLVEAAERLTDDALIGLHAGLHNNIRTAGGVAGLIMTSQPTVGDAMRNAFDVANRVCTVLKLVLEEPEDGQPRFAVRPRLPRTPYVEHMVEFMMGSIVANNRENADEGWSPASVSFVHRPKGDVAAYEDAFGCRPTFQASRDEMTLTTELLQTQVAGFDAVTHPAIEQLLESLVASLPESGSVVDLARAHVLGLLPGDVPTVATCAEELGLSPRTLQHQLRQAGSSFRQVLDQVRYELARRQLAGTDEPIGDIAEQLGYSEAAAFHRAFRRWAGVAPSRYRTDQRQ